MLADKPYLSIPEAAAALDVSANSVRRWVKAGRLRANRLPSGRLRVWREDVEAILTTETTSIGAA